MSFEIPAEIEDYIKELDGFIDTQIKPIEQVDDNIRSLTIAESTPAPIGTIRACRAKSGKSFWSA